MANVKMLSNMFEALAVRSIPNHVKRSQPMHYIELSNRLRIFCDEQGTNNPVQALRLAKYPADELVKIEAHLAACIKHWRKDETDFLN